MKHHQKLYLFLLSICLLFGCTTGVSSEVIEDTVLLTSRRNTQIHATFVYPKKHTNKVKLVVYAHGFHGSRDARGLFSQSANELARQGIASIRIDFPGHGDSSEGMASYTIEEMQHDLASAIAYAKESLSIDEEHIGIIGYSMGGDVTGMMLKQQSFSAVLLLAPALATGYDVASALWGEQEILDQLLANNEERSMLHVTTWGEESEISKTLLEELITIDPISVLHTYTGNFMMITGEQDTIIPHTITDKVMIAADHAKLSIHVKYPQTGHDFGATIQDDNAVVKTAVIHQIVDFFETYV